MPEFKFQFILKKIKNILEKLNLDITLKFLSIKKLK